MLPGPRPHFEQRREREHEEETLCFQAATAAPSANTPFSFRVAVLSHHSLLENDYVLYLPSLKFSLKPLE